MRLRMECARIALGEREVLRDVSADFRPGALTGVIGPNGSGKTTLLRALAGLLPMRAGTIWLDGKPIGAFSRKEVARRVGYLAQKQETAFPFRVDETVLMGRYAHQERLAPETRTDREAVKTALRDVDAADLASRAISELSGGELQRVLLARTLAAQTPVLLLDEPFANLDVRHCLDILRILLALARAGRTVVVSAHDLNLTSRYCDSLLLLHEGKILAQGNARSVLRSEIIERAFHVRARILSVGEEDERHFIMRAMEEEHPRPTGRERRT